MWTTSRPVNKANMRRGLDIPARAIHIDRYQTHSTFFQPSILKLKQLRILMTQPDENLSQKTFSSRNNDSTEIRHRVQNQWKSSKSGVSYIACRIGNLIWSLYII